MVLFCFYVAVFAQRHYRYSFVYQNNVDSGVKTPISAPEGLKLIENGRFQVNIAVCAPRFGIKSDHFRVLTVESMLDNLLLHVIRT